MIQDAVIRQLEIIGETTKCTSSELCSRYPGIPYLSHCAIMLLTHKESANDNHDTALIELIQELSPASHEEVRDFVEFLIAKQRRELARQAEANGWQGRYRALRQCSSLPMEKHI